MKLRVVSIDENGRVRVAADGPITSEAFLSCADNPLQELLGDGWCKHRILLDLSKADYIDSSAVGWLINCHKALTANGGLMVLHSAQPKVLRILKTLKIESILPLVDDISAASAVTIGS